MRISALRFVLREVRRNPRAAASIVVLTFIVAIAIAAPVISHYSPTEQDFMQMLETPSAEHWLGTDDLGRDVLTRLIYGAALTLTASSIAVAVALAIGLPFGLLAGYQGGYVDVVISRAIDTMLSFPAIILAIAVTAALGVGLTNSMLAMGVVFSPIIARLARAQTLVVKNELYIEAVRGFGASTSRIIIFHVMPNAIQPVIVQVPLLFSAALLAEAGLSFIGIGAQPPQPSWGAMLARSYSYLEVAPLQMVMPGMAILITSLAFNVLGESLGARLDPRART